MVFLREVNETDLDLLFNWANDKDVRKNSFNTEIIKYENHVKWFEKMISDDNVLQFIMTDEEVPIGQIRLNIDGDRAEIGYSIGKEYRGKGYGHKILELATDLVNKKYPEIKTLIAKVKPANRASCKLFETEGFDLKYCCYEIECNGN